MKLPNPMWGGSSGLLREKKIIFSRHADEWVKNEPPTSQQIPTFSFQLKLYSQTSGVKTGPNWNHSIWKFGQVWLWDLFGQVQRVPKVRRPGRVPKRIALRNVHFCWRFGQFATGLREAMLDTSNVLFESSLASHSPVTKSPNPFLHFISQWQLPVSWGSEVSGGLDRDICGEKLRKVLTVARQWHVANVKGRLP